VSSEDLKTMTVYTARTLSLCLFASAAIHADQVTLKNGDRVTGSIVKSDGKTLVISTPDIKTADKKPKESGEVTVAWDQVVAIETSAPVFIAIGNDKPVSATLATRDGRVEVESGGARRQVALADISALRDAAEQREYERLLSPRWLDLWQGSFTLGFAGTQGNAEAFTAAAAFKAARITRSDKTTVYLNAIRASAEINNVSETTAQAVRGGWSYGKNISSRFFVNVFNDYEYDRFQNLDLRFVLGGGLGYIAWQVEERGRLDILAGVAYNREKFSPPRPQEPFTRNSAEAYFGDDFTYTLNDRVALYQNFRVFPNLSDGGEYRINFDAGANTKLTRWLTWNVGLSDRFLSNPVPGRLQNDLLYTTGIGITFAR
jgi:hypothetical protein